jgi:hypothetical protein
MAKAPSPGDELSSDQRLALRAFDLFCSAGRPQRPTEGSPGPELVEVFCSELFDAFLKLHPSFEAHRREIMSRLPTKVRVHAEWWRATNPA